MSGTLLQRGVAASVLGTLVASYGWGEQPVLSQGPSRNGLPAAPGSSRNRPTPPPGTILEPGENPIDLDTALRLAGAENPEFAIARQRVSEATAIRQLAAAQLLPNLNVGMNYDLHRGALQQSAGNILKVNRDSLYVGLGANAIGGGTVNIPGLNYNFNVGEAWYGILASRQRVVTASAAADAVRNDVLLRVCSAYLDLLRSEGRQAVAKKNREEGAEVARLTAVNADAGQGRRADAERAAVELNRRDAELTQAEGETIAATARLAQLLNMDSSVRLKPVEGSVVPTACVPDSMAVSELLAVALMQRPELAARRSEVRTALYELSAAKVLPFSPTVLMGFSAGGFGGGSNLVSSPAGFVSGDGTRVVAPRFSELSSRTDFDVAIVWTFRNLGVGNMALIRAADSRLKQSGFRELETLNLVRSQVVEARGWIAARGLQIDAAEKAMRASQAAYKQDLARVRGGQGLPLELVDSLRLLSRSRYEYLDSVVEYNRAQFQLWVALGKPPAAYLCRPVPTALIPVAATAAQPGPRVVPVVSLLPGLRSVPGLNTIVPARAVIP